jgi:hypothetical protein
MQKLILDEELRARLHSLDTELVLCDEKGQTIGHFLPAEVYRRLLYACAESQFQDAEELQRLRQEPGGMTTTEAITYLEEVARKGRPNHE